ncbi:MAG: hypothetical protein V4683_06545 [Bacteroidota bacterium]
MKKIHVFYLFCLFIGISCNKDEVSSQTKTINLQIDGYNDNSTKVFQSGFIKGESVAVTLGPVKNSYMVTQVSFLFGGAASTAKDVIVKIYTDLGDEVPGTILYSSTFSVPSSDNVLYQIDLSKQNIEVGAGSNIRVSLEAAGSGLPFIAIDNDGTISQTKNWVKTTGKWVSATSLSLKGDFIIRAKVEEKL